MHKLSARHIYATWPLPYYMLKNPSIAHDSRCGAHNVIAASRHYTSHVYPLLRTPLTHIARSMFDLFSNICIYFCPQLPLLNRLANVTYVSFLFSAAHKLGPFSLLHKRCERVKCIYHKKFKATQYKIAAFYCRLHVLTIIW